MGVLDRIDPRAIALSRGTAERRAQRILIVMHDFSGGGTEQVAIRLANRWAAAGRNVRIFCGSEAGPLRCRVASGVIVGCASPELPRGPLSRWRLGWKLARAVRLFRPDIVFGPGNFHLPVLASFGLHGPRGASIVCKISNPLVLPSSGWLARLTKRFTLRALTARIDGLVAMSPVLRDEARRYVSAKVVNCWEPITCSRQPGAAGVREPGLILTVGRLEPQKDHALAIDAMALLCRHHDARLVILGDGSQRPQLERKVRALGLEGRVSLPGYTDEVASWLARASCFLMTSRFEGYPAALVEALAAGVPVVTTRSSPAVSELAAENGLIAITLADSHAVARALDTVLTATPPESLSLPDLDRHDEARSAARYLVVFDTLVADAALSRSRRVLL